MQTRRPFPIPSRALVVSCQARPDNPLHGTVFMAAMAAAAEQGGARGLRLNGATDIRAVRARSSLPIIGILKRETPGMLVYITPDLRDARAVADAGASTIAIDATSRPRDGLPLDQLIAAIQRETGLTVMADIATRDEAMRAADLGADAIATTLSGYTDATAHRRANGPDLDLLTDLAGRLTIPLIAEGRYETPADVAAAFERGAHAVVVGTAITNPREITRRFAAACGNET